MTNAVSTPDGSLSGGSAGNSAGLNTLQELQVILPNLETGAADITASHGLKALTIGAGAVGAAGAIQIGNAETAAEAAANLATLTGIAAFCEANGTVVQVDAYLTNPAIYSDGENTLVDQWATAAAQAGLPIASMEDGGETGISQSSSNLADTATIEANAIRTLIKDYRGSSYTLNASNLGIGDMEGGGAFDVASISAWISALDAANAKLGLQNVSYVTADTSWFAAWIDPLPKLNWQAYLEALSWYAVSSDISLNVIIQGAETDVSVSQFVEQAEQLAVYRLQLQASGSVTGADLSVEAWQIQPICNGLLISPNSMVNLAAELNAVASLYVEGQIPVSGTVTTSAPGQIILNANTVQAISGLSVRMTLADILSGGRLGVVMIDQTGTLSASQFGSGTVSKLARNILVHSGDAADLAKEQTSVTVDEFHADPDTIDMETLGAQRRSSDDQITVVATAGSSGSVVVSSSPQQGWLSANDVLNSFTSQGSGSVLTNQTPTSSGTAGVLQPHHRLPSVTKASHLIVT